MNKTDRQTDRFLAVVSGALEILSGFFFPGALLFLLLVAIKYAFMHVDDSENYHLIGLCMSFGVMVYFWRTRKYGRDK